LGRMSAVSREGRTVLFVSHNMGSIAQLCQTGILLDHGQIVESGDIQSVIGKYLHSGAGKQAELEFSEDATKPVQVRRLQVLDEAGKLASDLDSNMSFRMAIDTVAHEDVRGTINLALSTPDGVRVCHSVCADV